MSKARRPLEGTFLRIPLQDGSFGYGRVLAYANVGFYDYRTTEPSSDLDTIASRPRLFATGVRVPGADRWARLGARPLEGEMAKPAVKFMQDLADYRRCTIFDSEGLERPATPQECVGQERSAVWDAHHIERRLLDHFMGRPNEQVLRSRVRFNDD